MSKKSLTNRFTIPPRIIASECLVCGEAYRHPKKEKLHICEDCRGHDSLESMDHIFQISVKVTLKGKCIFENVLLPNTKQVLSEELKLTHQLKQIVVNALVDIKKTILG